ncbi:MAG: hypothetical protein PVJ33_11715 [Lysobacterales bacterium]|jgi:hypothetical protein
MKNTRLAYALLAVCLAGCSASGAPMTLKRLVAANTEARGGAEAIENVHAVEFELEITEPGFTVAGHYRATREGFMRIDIFAGGERVYTEAVGPDGAWQMRKDETVGTPETEAGAAIKRRGIVGNLYGLHELAGLGYTLTFEGARTIAGKDYWVIEKRAPDGFSETVFLDKSSNLDVREVDTSALHPDLNPAKERFETMRLDYRPTAGVLFVRKSEKRNLATREVVQTVLVKSVRVNPTLDEALFQRPRGSDTATFGD